MTGYAPFNRIMDYLAVSDFCVNLRYPTAGETSGSVLRIMAAGKPVIVSNVGWFSEIPDSCCLKVDVDSYEEEILLECMKLLSYDIRLRGALGANAKSYVIKEHDPEKIAREYYMFIRNILNGNEIIIEDVSEKLIELGIRDNDEDIIRKVSERVHELF
jgi:glycosyltransferase involved in cell wall biosynthesis